MPPNHCVIERQKKMPWPYSEKSRNTVAPVVARADPTSPPPT